MARDYEGRIGQLQTYIDMLKDHRNKQGWDGRWADVRDNLAPERGRNLEGSTDDSEYNDGTWNRDKIADPIAEFSLNVAANGMVEGLTSRQRPWFKVSSWHPEIADDHRYKEWFQYATTVMHGIFGISNFYKVIPDAYKELLAFSTSSTAQMPHPTEVNKFQVYTIGEVYCDSTDGDRVDVNARVFYMTPRAMVQEYGKDALPDEVLRAYNTKGGEKLFRVCHVVMPSWYAASFGYKPRNPSHEWASINFMWGSSTEEKPLRVAGFYENPIHTARWSVVSNNVYGGESPGFITLPHIKLLYAETDDNLTGISKGVNPPLIGYDHPALVQDFPNGYTHVQDSTGDLARVQPLYGNYRHDTSGVVNDIQRISQQIRQGFYNDMFLMIQNKGERMTATEVLELTGEKMMMLAPVFQRIHDELLSPICDNMLRQAARLGLIPPPPDDGFFNPATLRIEFTSLLAQAQKAAQVRSIEQGIAFAGQIQPIFPDILDNFDGDAIVRDYADSVGLPATLMHDPDDVAERRQMRAQAEAQQQAMLQMQNAAETAKTLAQAPMGEANVLTQLTGGPVQ